MSTKKITIMMLLSSTSVLFGAPVHAFEWRDLWATPEQRASKQLESQQFDELIETAPDANWRGLGEYQKGDYEAAAKSFAQERTSAEQANRANDSIRAMYNQANANVLNEQYEQAIDLFDEVLDINPEHQNAKHNRDVAEQLLEQQQQEQEQQQNSDDQDDQEQQDQEQQDQSEQDKQSDDQQDSEQQSEESQSDQQQADNQDGQSSDEQQSGGSSPDEQNQDEQSQEEQEAQAAEAAEALAAEQQAQEGQEQPENEAAQEGQPQAAAEPLTEREQANEQWLRKIPDDPAGLLQRKIQNRHLTDYPKVKDSVKPW